MATWLNATTDAALIPLLWPDAPDDTDGLLTLYLAAAQEACVAYAPARTSYATIPESWRMAQAMQAMNLYNAALASESGQTDAGGFGLTTHPLDWQVQQLLRPRRGLGAMV